MSKYANVHIVAVEPCGLCRGEGKTRHAGTGKPSRVGLVEEVCPLCDGKGERRTELLHPGEPFFLVRGQDALAPLTVEVYRLLLMREYGRTDQMGLALAQAAALTNKAEEFAAWQRDNPGLVKVAD